MNKLKIWKQMFTGKKVEAWQLKPDTKAGIWGTFRTVKYLELCDGHGNHKLHFTGSWWQKSVPALRIVFDDEYEMIVHPKRKMRCAISSEFVAEPTPQLLGANAS